MPVVAYPTNLPIKCQQAYYLKLPVLKNSILGNGSTQCCLCANYRTIILMSHLLKFFLRII